MTITKILFWMIIIAVAFYYAREEGYTEVVLNELEAFWQSAHDVIFSDETHIEKFQEKHSK